MDRRQLLFGMTALGLAGSLNLNELVSAQGRRISDQGPKVRMYPPDVELNEPRGPVKMCREETTMPDGSVLTNVSEYGRDGKMVSSRMDRDGRITYSSDERRQTEVRDDQGRLVRSVSGDREYSYTYDSAGRMLRITNSENSDRTEYHYGPGPDGVMISIQTFDPKTCAQARREDVGDVDNRVEIFSDDAGGRDRLLPGGDRHRVLQLCHARQEVEAPHRDAAPE